jgi:hypothetical protein
MAMIFIHQQPVVEYCGKDMFRIRAVVLHRDNGSVMRGIMSEMDCTRDTNYAVRISRLRCRDLPERLRSGKGLPIPSRETPSRRNGVEELPFPSRAFSVFFRLQRRLEERLL